MSWLTKKLGELLLLTDAGIWGDAPLSNEKSYPVIRSTEITHDGKMDLSNVTFRRIPEEKIEKNRLQNGDILLVASSGSPHLIGRAALFKQSGEAQIYLFSNFMIRIRPKNNVDTHFLYYFLSSSKYYSFLKSSQQTSTGLRNFPKKEFMKLSTPLPPLSEQRKIAEVLSTVDEGIGKVDEAIRKTERLKKGLMQKLLTEGIGHREFKDSEIGRIPNEWELVKLGNEKVYEVIMGQSPPSHTYNKDNKGLPFLQGKIEFGEIYPSPTIWCSKTIKIAEKDDVLISVRAPVGEVNISPAKICIGRGLSAIRCNPEKANHLFLFYGLKYKAKKMEAISSGSTFKAVRKNDIDNFKIPLPPLPEQRRIAGILSDVDKKIELERKRKSKLETIKKGLMNDLLTGRKRVKTEL